jgi:hypothetical protein
MACKEEGKVSDQASRSLSEKEIHTRNICFIYLYLVDCFLDVTIVIKEHTRLNGTQLNLIQLIKQEKKKKLLVRGAAFGTIGDLATGTMGPLLRMARRRCTEID